MRIAVISDIHSNIYALEAVIKDIESKKVDLTVCVGDLVGYCTSPNEVINLIRERNILTAMGNYDDAVGYQRIACGCDYPDPREADNAGKSLSFTINEVTLENKEFLKDLPKELKLTFGGLEIVFVHGSPRRLNEYLKEDSIEAKDVMSFFSEDILVCGHTHKPYYKYYGDKMLINAGSVGKPKTDNPNANYIIINIKDENTEVQIVEVPYDYETVARDIENKGLPIEFANLIRTGKAK